MRVISPKASHTKIGPDLVNKVASTYEKYVENPTQANRKAYMTWRLRIHLRCNQFMRAELEVVNDHFNLGLNDRDPGETFWDIEPG